MKIRRKNLLLSSVLTTAVALVSANALAQDTDATDDEVIVTGSRFTSPNVVSSSPVTTIDESAFERIGAIDAIDVLNRLPGVTAAQDSNVSNGATGTSSINLRGLGTNRNLVLIDGKRLGPGRPDISTADLNQIPTPLLERVDVVTGGASAVYGSDAIAGVTNFILKRDFEGFELSTTFGVFQDGNNNETAQEILELSSTDGVVPTNTQVDGETFDVSAVFGGSFADGRGHITGFGRFVNQDAVLQGTRDISRCATLVLGPEPGPLNGSTTSCLGSNFGPFPTTVTLGAVIDPATGLPAAVQPGFQGVISLDAAGNVPRDANGDIIAGSSNAFNFNPTNFFQRPTQRFQGGFLANYEITDNVEAYFDATFFRNVTDAQIAPSATFGEIQQINCDNPFLTADLVDIICTQRGFGVGGLGPDLLANTDDDNNATVQVNRRFVEGGGRNSLIELDNIRLVGGFRGDIGDTGWAYDVFGQFSTTSSTTTNTNDGNIELLQEALLVVDGPNGPVCTSGSATCLPLNLFGTSPVDTTALANVLTPTILAGEVTQEIVGATIQGSPEQFTSPLADNPVNVLVGVEYRADRLQSQPDSILIVGGATGLGGPADPVDGVSEVYEIFGEVNIPLVEGQAFAENLALTGQYRYSDYSYENGIPGGEQSDGFATNAFSVGATWTPVSDIRFRGQFQRAVRAPNVFELFSPQSLGLFNDNDPCSGTAPTATVTQCSLTGLSPALFGLVQADAGQLQALTGGNTALQPEESDTITLGAVFRPSFVEGLTLSVDYYDISIDDFISTVPPQTILDDCLDGSQPEFCSFINRDALGTLQVDGFITASLQNIAERVAQGFDIAANYNFSAEDFGLGNWGDFSLNYVGNIVTALEQTSFPGAGVTDSNGLFGGSTFTGEVNPEYRHVASLGWVPNDALSFNLDWRYIGGTVNDGDFTGESLTSQFGTFDAENYFDLFAQWNATEQLVFSAGVNNLLDNDPPISDFRFTANGNTFPSTFDSLGRYIFVGAKIRL